MIATVVAIIIIIGAAAAGHKSSPSSGSAASPTMSGFEKEARSFIKEHVSDANRVQASVQAVEIGVAQAAKSETESSLDELAQLAQTAHDNLNTIRNDFASGSYSGEVEKASAQVFTSANGLKNAMGALVAYTGNPDPATLAHFTSQYMPAKEEWDEGVSAIWRLAHEANPPTLEPSAKEDSASGNGPATTAAPAQQSCAAPSGGSLKSLLEAAANESHTIGYSTSKGACLTNIKVAGEWAAAEWPGTQPAAIVFRQINGRWHAVTGGSAVTAGPHGEPIPKGLLEGEP